MEWREAGLGEGGPADSLTLAVPWLAVHLDAAHLDAVPYTRFFLVGLGWEVEVGKRGEPLDYGARDGSGKRWVLAFWERKRRAMGLIVQKSLAAVRWRRRRRFIRRL